MHKHDEHTEGCDVYVAAEPCVNTHKSGYWNRQRMVGMVTGATVTVYHFATYDNWTFTGKNAKAHAVDYATCTGRKYKSEVRNNGQVFHVVRFDH